MTKTANRALEDDIKLLKASFGYRDFSADMDILEEDLDRPLYSDENRAGRARIWVAEEFLLDAYYEKGALEPLVRIYSGYHCLDPSRYDRLMSALSAQGANDLIRKFWLRLIRFSETNYRQNCPRGRETECINYEVYRKGLIGAYTYAIDWMKQLGDTAEAEALTQALEDFESNKEPEPLPPPTDLRKIDETVFWELIRQSADGTESLAEHENALAARLEQFKAVEIKRFISLYAKRMKSLYHWDVWALAYAARGGCSDGSFEAFRSMLILRGDPALLDIALKSPDEAATHIEKDPDIADGALPMLLSEAYYRRRGQEVTFPSMELEKPKGKYWDEEALGTRYPDLVAHYEHA